jgi:hypothetical protein
MGFSLEVADFTRMEKRMNKRALILALIATGALAASVSACAPTIHVKVDPINIYAKLDANVRVQLDKEVQTAIQQNPNLF